MGSKRYYTLISFLAFFVGIGVIVMGWLVYNSFKSLSNPPSPNKLSSVLKQKAQQSQLKSSLPQIKIQKEGEDFNLVWQNLPKETEAIKIFRSPYEEINWAEWMTVGLLPGQISGKLSLESEENLELYQFYFEAVISEEGQVLWSSPTSGISVAAASESSPNNQNEEQTYTNQSPQISAGTNNQEQTLTEESQSQDQQDQTASNNQTTQQTTENTTQQDQIQNESTSPPPSEPEAEYYTPELQPRGNLPPLTTSFWVRYVNNRIEIGWQNLPPNTNRVIVLRSPSKNTGWQKLIEQKNPKLDSYFVRLLDNTIDEGYYYRLDVYEDNNLISSFGPEFLPPLL